MKSEILELDDRNEVNSLGVINTLSNSKICGVIKFLTEAQKWKKDASQIG